MEKTMNGMTLLRRAAQHRRERRTHCATMEPTFPIEPMSVRQTCCFVTVTKRMAVSKQQTNIMVDGRNGLQVFGRVSLKYAQTTEVMSSS